MACTNQAALKNWLRELGSSTPFRRGGTTAQIRDNSRHPKRTGPGAIEEMDRSAHGSQTVTRLETLVPCAKWRKAATVATKPKSNQWGIDDYDDSKSRSGASTRCASHGGWPARGTLRGAISPCPAGSAVHGKWRHSGSDSEHLRQRRAFLAGQSFGCRARPQIFHVHAPFDPRHAA